MEIIKRPELAIIKVDNIKALKEIEPEVVKLLEDNQFIEPTNETIQEAEQVRKNLKKGRTTLENLRKEITGPILDAKKAIDGFADEFKIKISEAETKQETANNKYLDLELWESVKKENTIEGYEKYLNESKVLAYQEHAIKMLNVLKEQEKAEIEKFNVWKKETQDAITFADNRQKLDLIDQQLDLLNLEVFYNYDEVFEMRETFFIQIDKKKAQLIQSEIDKKEQEALRFKAEQEAKEAKERQAKAEEKARIEAEKAKKGLQESNFENAVFVLDSIKMSAGNISSLDAIKPYYTKLESVIEKDFGANESKIKELYATARKMLDDKNGELLQIEREKKAKQEAEEKAEADKLRAEQEQAEKERQALYQAKIKELKSVVFEAITVFNEDILADIQELYPEKDCSLLSKQIEEIIFNFLKP